MGLHFTVLIIHYACFPHTNLNHAFVYFNQICATVYLMYPLHVKEFTRYVKLLHELTTEPPYTAE